MLVLMGHLLSELVDDTTKNVGDLRNKGHADQPQATCALCLNQPHDGNGQSPVATWMENVQELA